MEVMDDFILNLTMEVDSINSIGHWYLNWQVVVMVILAITTFTILITISITNLIIVIVIIIIVAIIQLETISIVTKLFISSIKVIFIELEYCFYFIVVVISFIIIENLSLFFVKYWLKENFILFTF